MVDAVKKSATTEELKENLKEVKAATPEQIRAGVLNDVSGITPEMTYTKDSATFIYELQKQLNIGLANGDRYSTTAKRISQRCEIAYRRSMLIIRTETHRVREKGFLDSGLELNGMLKQSSTPIRLVKTWQSMQDERVRDTKEANHRIVNGESKELDEEFTLLNGVNAKAPGQSGTAYNDCNCRCFLVYEIKSNEADKALGENTPKSIDFGGGSGIIKIKNAVGKEVIPVERSELFGEPNSITQYINSKGGIDRNYYDENRKQFKQISNHDHGHKKESKFGNHGEHAHDYYLDDNGKPQHDEARELTDKEREENGDIL